MSCHTIHVLTATRMSHGLLSPVTGGSKSCGNRLHHAIPYMSLPSACHMVCCLPSCHVSPYNTIQHFNQHVTRSAVSPHAMSVPTIPYNTSVSMSHGLLTPLMPCQSLQYHTTLQSAHHMVRRFSLGQQSHTTHHISYHITPYYSIEHHIHHFTLYHTIQHHAMLYNIHYTTHHISICLIPYVYNTTHQTS